MFGFRSARKITKAWLRISNVDRPRIASIGQNLALASQTETKDSSPRPRLNQPARTIPRIVYVSQNLALTDYTKIDDILY